MFSDSNGECRLTEGLAARLYAFGAWCLGLSVNKNGGNFNIEMSDN